MSNEVNLGNGQVAKNMIFSFISFAISLFISFFFTPYLIGVVGKEAYSFFPLTNNFISYTGILTTAVGSMAARFIIMEFYGGNMEKAKVYFNTVFVAYICLSILFSFVALGLVINLDAILTIPIELVSDVKILFTLTFFCMIVSLPLGIFSVGLSVKNRNDIASRLSVIQNLIRVGFMLGLFYLFQPTIVFIGLAGCVSMIIGLCYSIYYKITFLPEIPINPRRYFDIKAVWTLVSSGIWNSFNQLSAILLNQVDLLICNIFINASATGELAIAKTCPVMIDTIMNMVAGAFMSKYNILLAQGRIESLVHEINKAMKVTSTIIGIPLGMLLVFGEEFFTLWVPTVDAHKIYLISCLTIGPMIIGASIYPIFGTYTITNKLKIPAIVLFIAGSLNLGIIYIVLKTTNLGIWAIPVVSAIQYSLRHSTFSIIYGAKSICQKWWAFYPVLFRGLLGELIVLAVGFTAKYLYSPDSWIAFIVEVGCVSIIALVANSYFSFNKTERTYLFSVIKSKIKR